MSSSPSLQNDALQRIEKFVEPPAASTKKMAVARGWKGKAIGEAYFYDERNIFIQYQIACILIVYIHK